MKHNMGIADRLIRLIIAALIIFMYYTNVLNGIWATVLLFLSGVMILTSTIGFCPLYAPFKIKTCAKEKI
ncbi:YgaP family membrane protein [Solitalea koreensis]|uniref:Inner membrane protein YgaP-like transmembrane domain-containing protein n=1 Tax=Solitalea koreensis TaxID=543615 RepID=A0A521D2T4_9SPHI|nr:DUF2892 domain-containing protein [Solitalea koreensis]SMO66005.1 Protein of unknown function [Solitalea koreensis]